MREYVWDQEEKINTNVVYANAIAIAIDIHIHMRMHIHMMNGWRSEHNSTYTYMVDRNGYKDDMMRGGMDG